MQQPAATPPELVDNLRRDVEEIARVEVAKYNERRTASGQRPDVEYLIHPGERVRLVSHTRPSTLLIDVAADELAINIVLATGHEAHPGYPRQVPLRILLDDGQPVLHTGEGTGSPRDVLADTFAEYFRALDSLSG